MHTLPGTLSQYYPRSRGHHEHESLQGELVDVKKENALPIMLWRLLQLGLVSKTYFHIPTYHLASLSQTR